MPGVLTTQDVAQAQELAAKAYRRLHEAQARGWQNLRWRQWRSAVYCRKGLEHFCLNSWV